MAEQKRRRGRRTVGKTRKGVPNKSHTLARERLEELDCDPLEFTALIMKGEELKGAHPFLTELLNKLDRLEKAFDRRNMTVEAKITATLTYNAKLALGEGETDKTLRANAASKLLEYAYPKLRAMDVKIEKEATQVEEMEDDELISFLRNDNEKQDGTKKPTH